MLKTGLFEIAITGKSARPIWPARLAGDEFVVVLELPHDPQEPARLLARAEQAMYEAKRRGRGWVASTTAEPERETF